MRLILLLFALVAAVQTVRAQTSATVYVQPSTGANSYSGFMTTSFIGLKLPSGGGSVSITVSPGDWADGTYATSYADHTQDGPYYIGGPSTSFTIGTTGHYWFYLSEYTTTNNYDYMEIRVEASTYSGDVTCYYCAPPSGWTSGWPPYGTSLLSGPASDVPITQPAYTKSSSSRVPTWVIPILAIVIALAVFVPTSYMVYRCVQNKKAKAQAQAQAGNNHTYEIEKTTQLGTHSQVELQTVTAV